MTSLPCVLVVCGAIVAGFLLGRLFPKSNTRRVRNPHPHQAADLEYTVATLNGTKHAFTSEAIATARSRAIKIESE